MVYRKLYLAFLIQIFIWFYFLCFPSTTLAVTTTIKSYPSTISTDSFDIEVSIEGANSGQNYLKIDLFKDKEGTKNYFGETFNGNDWYGGSDGLLCFPITIEKNVPWNGTVKGRVGNPTVTEFDGTGSYKLRVRRYTSSGSSYSADEANEGVVSINISILSPTLIPTSSPTSTTTPIPTRTPIPSKTPTPNRLPTSSNLSTSVSTSEELDKKTINQSIAVNEDSEKKEEKSVPTSILGLEDKNENFSPTPKISNSEANILGVKTTSLSKFFLVLGVIVIFICVILVGRKYKVLGNEEEI